MQWGTQQKSSETVPKERRAELCHPSYGPGDRGTIQGFDTAPKQLKFVKNEGGEGPEIKATSRTLSYRK